ncbi:MAG: hypothetical protein GC165_19475 [Armatimonadetes bacterium]|nr:hypothetical protein [Armatimonadota bacterium]
MSGRYQSVWLAILVTGIACNAHSGGGSTSASVAIEGDRVPPSKTPPAVRYGPASDKIPKDISKTKLAVTAKVLSKSPSLRIAITVTNLGPQKEEDIYISVDGVNEDPEITKVGGWIDLIDLISAAKYEMSWAPGESKVITWVPDNEERKALAGQNKIRFGATTPESANFGGLTFYSKPVVTGFQKSPRDRMAPQGEPSSQS